MIRILVADDHDVVRRGVRDILQINPDWQVTAEAADGREAVEMALKEKPNVIVLDVSLPVLNGIGVTRQIRQALPQTEILLFTMHEDEETISGGLAAGARGYLLKSDRDEHLINAVGALASHRTYFSDCVSEVLLDAALHDRRKSQLEGFTGRELQIAQLIAEGQSNKEIARDLGLSLKTVESHRAAAMRKAGVRTAAELVRFAIRHKLIQA